MYPCFYKLSGCNEMFPMHLIEEHEQVCSYGNHQCPFARISKEDCDWLGPFSAINKHVKKNHSKNGDYEETDVCVKTVLINVCEHSNFRQVIFTLGKTFYVLSKTTGNTFFCVVFYVGPLDESAKYKYRFSLSKKEIGTISYCLFTRGFNEDSSQVFEAGNCVVIHYGCLENFMEGNCLPYEIEFFEHEDCDDSGDKDI
jgi:hypothetical protein